jgi:hypothetical protein
MAVKRHPRRGRVLGRAAGASVDHAARATVGRATRASVGRVGALVASAVLIGGGGPAGAHPELSALGTNRTIAAAVFDGRVDVTDVLIEGALVSGDERKGLDADGDGLISEAEARAGEERQRALGPALTVEVDGRALSAPLAVTIDLGNEPRASAAPLVVERRLSFPGAWLAGSRRLRVALTREPPRPLDTEIGVVLGPGLTLASGAERATFRGPRASTFEERAATFEILGPPPAPAKLPTALRVPVLLVGIALLWVARLARRRSRRSARP